ncbi:MAG TPA: DnaA/Hda family protein, partial [Gemmatimonadales bacterium]|nr:DnaA/Hda family protein [Gemmatimonadales bacterium]
MELNPKYRFETFVVGPSNKLAATAAHTVASNPGTSYNPLFLYGRSGLGKTHLLHAIGFAAFESNGQLRVQYLTLEEFVDQYHRAVAAGQAEAFHRSAEETDVLLLDDVQFLVKHREMQAELLRISEALQESNRQLVLTSDRPPSEIEDLDERLITRLSGGLLVDLAPPDYETRLAILRRKAEERQAAFGAGVLETVADITATNVRELVGLVNRLIAFQAVSETPLTPEGARALLGADGADGAEGTESSVRQQRAQGDQGAQAAPQVDEFSAFLSAVTRTVAQSIDAWRAKVGEAVMRWQGEGYRTDRLEALLKQESLADVDQVLARFEADIAELQRLATEASELDPSAAGHARFRDPNRLEEAREYVLRLVEGLVPPPAPNPALRLQDYITGSANEAVVRAARIVAQEPGQRFNPLYISGPSGVGKTHLLHAIGNALLESQPGRAVVCLSAQAFVEDLVSALDAGNVEWWRRRYRRADAFLLDDVHLLAGKEQTQEELFNLFNALAEAEKQLVFTADRLPDKLENIAHRLVTRFEGGLVVELAAPDRAMREVMVRRLL